LFSARASSPRVHLTDQKIDNPQSPPMLCMLFRKKLCGAKLVAIRQPSLERILFFDFEATNDLGDKIKLTNCINYEHDDNSIINGMIGIVTRVGSEKSTFLVNADFTLPNGEKYDASLRKSEFKLVSDYDKIPEIKERYLLKLRNGDETMVDSDYIDMRKIVKGKFKSNIVFSAINMYDKDLRNPESSSCDIMEIYKPTYEKIWERLEEEPKKMTVKEIVEKLGYDIEIVKEK
jgi:hypothetical protein